MGNHKVEIGGEKDSSQKGWWWRVSMWGGAGRLSQEERKERLGKQSSAFSLNKQWDDITQTTHIHSQRHFFFILIKQTKRDMELCHLQNQDDFFPY